MGFGDMVNSVLHRAGAELRRYPAATEFEAEVMYFLNEEDIDCVIDVGAHKGEFAATLRLRGYRERIVSFEPMRDAFTGLQERASLDERWQVRRQGVGSRNQELQLNVTRDSRCVSALSPSSFGMEVGPDMLRVVGTETVECVRLDSVWDECTAGISSPRVLLKTDTQGFDLQVIEGAGERIRDARGVLIETTIAPLYEGAPHLFEVMRVMEGLGFYLSGITHLAHAQGRRIVELDCLFRRP